MRVPSLGNSRSNDNVSAASLRHRELELLAREAALDERERRLELNQALMQKVERKLEERKRELEEREAGVSAGEEAVAAALELEELGADDSYPDETQWWELQVGRKLQARSSG